MDYDTLYAFAEAFESLAKRPWSKKPKGWKAKSVKQYSKTMMGGEKHPFTECVKKMKNKVDNPERFCGSVKDKFKGTTKWRGKE